MTFLAPTLLFGSLAVASPIIIHLLARRQVRRVPWAAMRFLQKAVERNQRRMKAARDAFWRMDSIFESSIDAAGATAWNAVNAYTEWLEHSRPIRVKNLIAKAEQRLSAKLFGVDADRALASFVAAIAV